MARYNGLKVEAATMVAISRTEERSLAMHQVIAQRLAQDPSVLDRAKANLERWNYKGNPALEEWHNILCSWPREKIVALLTERTENAARLRSSTPFTGVLSQPERARIYASF